MGAPVMWTPSLQEMSDFVAAAEQYMADYVIIECNAEAINRGIFNNLEFDYKVLTLFEETDNQHMDADKYFKTKLNFFTINPCKSILNKSPNSLTPTGAAKEFIGSFSFHLPKQFN